MLNEVLQKMNSPVRVLCVFSRLDRGGAETMCMNLYRCIDRDMVQFDFVKHTPEKGAYEDEIKALGGEIFEAPRYKIKNHIEYTNWWKKHLQEHHEHRIIHGHFFTISSIYFEVAKKFNCITIGHSHCTPSNKKTLRHYLFMYFVSKIEKHSDYCFACSKPAGEWVFKHKDFKVLNNAIDSVLFRFNTGVRSNYRKQFDFSDDTLVLGTVANFLPVKNPMGLIDIFKAVQRQRPDSKLLWVGEGPCRKEIEERLENEGLKKDVILTGSRGDVAQLLQAMDAFIFPSKFEGLGIVAVEAQAAGLHCFCSDQVPEEASVTGNCTFLPLGDAEQWAKAILSTNLSRKDTQQQIIDAGYDIHTTVDWLQNFYLKCADR